MLEEDKKAIVLRFNLAIVLILELVNVFNKFKKCFEKDKNTNTAYINIMIVKCSNFAKYKITPVMVIVITFKKLKILNNPNLFLISS